MKKKNAKPTRAKRGTHSAPILYRCSCGHVAFSKYGHKEHKEVCTNA